MPRKFCVVVVATLLAALSVALAAARAAETPPRPESQQEYWAQVDHKDWGAAITAAEQLVAAAREHVAQQPLALAEALSLLGNAHYGAKDYASAEKAFTEAIQTVEQHAGVASPKLLDPLRGLGYTLASAGRHKEAIPPLERALLIDRRSYGLFDIGQQNVLRQLAESLFKTGRLGDAERHVTYLVQLGERVYGRRDPRQVPILCFAAEWHADIGDFSTARMIYRHAVGLIDQKLGPNDPTAVEPLRALAGTYTQELYYSTLGLRTQSRERMPTDADGSSNDTRQINPRYLNTEGEKALDRAIKILEAQPPSVHDTLVATLIQTGDWYQIKHVPDKALPLYRRAAALNATLVQAATESAPAAADTAATPEPAPLSFPVRVYYPAPSGATRNTTLPADQVDERYVEVQFTVTSSGDVSDAKITGASGTPREAADALSAIRAARFRPKFVGGEPVETTGMSNREVFRTRKESVEGGR
ncbi:MAG TPA: TonB family protein [Steroidobacteraceae bacterium]|nr:TonB family protein [Steroidobacteraceae bacterium]